MVRRGRPRTTLLLSLSWSLAALGCPKDDDKGEETPSVQAKPEAEPAPSPGVQDDGTVVSAVGWFDGTLEQALVEAAKESKLVLLDVGAYWCPPCHRLDEEVFTRSEVGEYLGEHFVAVHVDAEKGEGPELADRYRVQAFPTLLVLEPTGVEKDRIVDFVPPDELVQTLDRIRAGGNVLADLEAKVESNPDDVQARYALGHAYALAARPAEAEAQYQAVLLADPGNEMGLASKVAYDRAMFLRAKLDKDLPAVIDAFRELQRRFPQSKEANRAYRQIGRALHQLGRDEEALASLDQMLAEDPDDPVLAANYGWFCFRQKVAPQRGLEVVDKALASAPEEAELHYLKAELEHLSGNEARAAEAMRKASELEPRSAYYKRQLRELEARVGS